MVVDVCHWYVLVGKGSISLPFPCVRGWKRFHTRTRQSRVQLRVRRTTNPAPAAQPGRLRCKTHQQSKEILLTNQMYPALCVPAFSVLPRVALVISFLVFPPFPLLFFHFPFFFLCLALPTL